MRLLYDYDTIRRAVDQPCGGSTLAALAVRGSHDKRKQIVHLFLVPELCSNCKRKVLPVKTNISWKDLYAAAMLELDRANLPNRIESARAAIRQALDELASDRDFGAIEEAQALADALRNLQALQRVECTPLTPPSGQGQALAEG
jgi:hypothetical protein